MNAGLDVSGGACWQYPHCPEPPDWHLDWPALLDRFPWLRALERCAQEPLYHGEGDVLIHTRMVCEALTALPAWRALAAHNRSILFAAALLHDVGKPNCTVVEADGRISARGHARLGARLVHQILYTEEPFLSRPVPFTAREAIVRLVRHHGLPPYLLGHDDPRRAVIAASQVARCDWLALLAEADVRGRLCRDKDDLLSRVALFAAYAEEQRCLSAPYPFPSDLSRFTYFHKEHGDPDFVPFDASRCEVVLLSGLPAAGKDTYARSRLADWPAISLDSLRAALGVPPTGDQGAVVAAAREQAREYLRAGRDFVWNATNISRQTRGRLVKFFVAYGARVRIVYLEAPYALLLERNRARRDPLPDAALLRLAHVLEVPDRTEAHRVEIITA